MEGKNHGNVKLTIRLSRVGMRSYNKIEFIFNILVEINLETNSIFRSKSGL